MKNLGLIGGMSWESSAVYYKLINEFTRERLGNGHSSECIMFSVDFSIIEKLQHQGEWVDLGIIMGNIARRLEDAGADAIVICTNTMHLLAPKIESKVQIPIIHIADATARAILKLNLKKVSLLGTRFTMEKDFYRSRLKDNFNIDVIIPEESDRIIVHDIIYNELINGIISENSKEEYKRIINKMMDQGAEGVILGCTEIPLLIKQEDSPIPVFDTTFIHAKEAVEFALK